MKLNDLDEIFSEELIKNSQEDMAHFILKTTKQNRIALKALKEITEIDFRGNRSSESQIAYRALREIKELQEQSSGN